MDALKIKSYFSTLSSGEQEHLLSELTTLNVNSEYNLIELREIKFNEKQGVCPHCGNIKYTKMGKDKDVQRYKCKNCNKTFTPFTGTWMTQIHKKDKLADYLKLMREGLSLDKIRDKLGINKKTAFDWRHKIAHSLEGVSEHEFTGITESDETFFLRSEKGSVGLNRKARKRGKQVKTRGINKEQVAVIATADRKSSISLEVSGFGRIGKDDITKAIGDRIIKQTILCTDGHVSFKSFAIENNLEHHVLKASIKEFVKEGKFHIQHINSLHSRLKKWINEDLFGVASKYLQNYLSWFKFMEEYKTTDYMKSIVTLGIENTNARKKYLDAVKNRYSIKNNVILI